METWGIREGFACLVQIVAATATSNGHRVLCDRVLLATASLCFGHHVGRFRALPIASSRGAGSLQEDAFMLLLAVVSVTMVISTFVSHTVSALILMPIIVEVRC